MNKTIILFIAILSSQIAVGQEIIQSSFIFNHVALSVKDADLSADFYRNTLNLKEITNKTEIDGIRWFSLGEGKELHLISLPDEIKTNKAVHFALKILL